MDIMAEKPKLLYIIVQDEELENTEKGRKSSCNSFRYTRPVLQSTLQLMGCKARHAFKISKRVYDILREEIPVKIPDKNGSSSQEFYRQDFSRHLSDSEIDSNREYSHEDIKRAAEENEIQLKEITKKLFTVQKKRSTVILNREEFLDVVCDAMSEYRYVGPNQRIDFLFACRIREKKTSMTILLCGTSGCGKSTLSTLLASRLGITTVISTDSIRHMMRSFVDEKENPLLWASTYHAGEHLDPGAVAEAKAKKKARKMARIPLEPQLDHSQGSTILSKVVGKEKHLVNLDRDIGGNTRLPNEGSSNIEVADMVVSSKTMAVQGYKAQSEMVIDSLDRLITSWEQKCESVIVEGVHLSLNFVMGLMKKHPSIIPFMVYISNEEKHLERFAVRAKYMTLDPAKNKYVKYIRNIRAIQDYLCKRADKHLIPKVNNTNMDRSVASIHATIFGCLRRREGGEPLYDQTTNTVKVVDEEYISQCAANSLGSKGMLQVIRRRGSSRQLIALVYTDGSVAKAWPFETADNSRKPASICSGNDGVSSSMYASGPLAVGPVNLQFGNFGLSAWPTDVGGTSHNGSIDGLSSRGDGTDYNSSHRSSHHGSSGSSSPRPGDGTEKELVNESTVSGSDEEQEEEALDADSDEELDIRNKQLEEELEGSVDDQSIRSDEEDEDLVAADEDEHSAEDSRRLGLVERLGKNTHRVSAEDLKKLQKTYRKDPGYGDPGYGTLQTLDGPLKENERVPRGNILSGHTPLTGRDANAKYVHGRSKSLPFLGSVVGNSVLLGNARV